MARDSGGLDFKAVSNVLGITEQQLEILVCIYRVGSSGRRTSPKEIRVDYQALYGRWIQGPNFFVYLKKLQDIGYVRRTGSGVYGIDFSVIKSRLEGVRLEKESELKEIDSLIEDTLEYFRKVAYVPTRPVVEYLKYESVFESITKNIKTANKIYISSNFPTICYTLPVANSIGRADFVKALWDRCFTKEKLEVYLLTTLDISYPFNHAFRTYGDPEKAYNECKIMVEQLITQVNTYDNLHVKYIGDLHGMDLLIPEKSKDFGELYMFTRDEHKNIQGGIHIQSPETAVASKYSFMRDFEYAQDLKGEKGEKIIGDVKKELEEKYGVLKV